MSHWRSKPHAHQGAGDAGESGRGRQHWPQGNAMLEKLNFTRKLGSH